ncbi:MAG: helix-turn-helix domain-containing protein [Clostridiales bacterium]|jgi:putative transcriptional regulator|nr:helix-turn-helix domain-containing protein [Clostridiales bacterium]
MKRKIIRLVTEKQLRAYMQPTRQRILTLLRSREEGMTAKQLADRLGIAPSSAGHHLKVLQEIGLVEEAGTKLVHGFIARYFRDADVDVTFAELPQAASDARRQAIRSLVMEDLERFLPQLNQDPKPQDADLMDGSLWLTPEEAAAIWVQIREFASAHSARRPGTQAYNFVVFGGPDREEKK